MNESALFCTSFCVLKLLVCPFVRLHVYPELPISTTRGWLQPEGRARGGDRGLQLYELLSGVYALAVGWNMGAGLLNTRQYLSSWHGRSELVSVAVMQYNHKMSL